MTTTDTTAEAAAATWIRCTIERPVDFSVPMPDGTIYTWRRYAPSGHQLAKVDIPAHAELLLSVEPRGSYVEWTGAEPQESLTISGAVDPAAVARALAMTPGAQSVLQKAEPEDTRGVESYNVERMSADELRAFVEKYLGKSVPKNVSEKKLRDLALEAQDAIGRQNAESIDTTLTGDGGQ